MIPSCMSTLICAGNEIQDLTDELVNDRVVNVAPIVPGDEHLPLHVQEIDGAARHSSFFLAPSKLGKQRILFSENFITRVKINFLPSDGPDCTICRANGWGVERERGRAAGPASRRCNAAHFRNVVRSLPDCPALLRPGLPPLAPAIFKRISKNVTTGNSIKKVTQRSQTNEVRRRPDCFNRFISALTT
jgi:hypothetical protein